MMDTIIRDILDRCPTHGHLTDMAHATGCTNQDHVDLLEFSGDLGGSCDCSKVIDAVCPNCEEEFTVDIDDI